MNLINDIKQVIETAIPESIVEILDPRNDQKHLEAIVASDIFEGISLLKQHQLVMKSLSGYFSSGLHALQLTTLTMKQYKDKQTT